MPSEGDIMRSLMKHLSAGGARVFRNNVGKAWVGRVVRRAESLLTLADPRPLEAGLCVGSADLIGWRSIAITPEMVGQQVAVFTAVETKTKVGRLSPDQANFLRVVHEAGGVAVIATRDEHASKVSSWYPGQALDVDVDRFARKIRTE
jgi:hypothetical protein